MAYGYYDDEGIWHVGEDDDYSPVSDMLGLISGSVSEAIGDDRARLAALETDVSAWTTITTWAAGYAAHVSYPCQVRRIGKVVRARGLVNRTAGSWAASTEYSSIFTVPVGFRPTGANLYLPLPVNLAGIPGAVGLLADAGTVTVRTGPTATSGYLSLAAMSWLVD